MGIQAIAGWSPSVRNKIPWLFPDQILFFYNQTAENLADILH